MSIISDIAERLPSADGGLRRRFLSGLLFLFALALGTFWFPGVPFLASTITDGLVASRIEWSAANSITATILLSATIFVVGHLIDVIGHIFINRFFFLSGGTLIYRGFRLFALPAQQSIYKSLPNYVQCGLRDPFGRQFEVSLRFLLHIAPDDEKIWLQQLDSRNKNIFSILSSMFLAVVFVATLSLSAASTDEKKQLRLENATMCYTDLVNGLRRVGLIRRQERREILNDIAQKNPEGSWEIERRLRALDSAIKEILSTASIEAEDGILALSEKIGADAYSLEQEFGPEVKQFWMKIANFSYKAKLEYEDCELIVNPSSENNDSSSDSRPLSTIGYAVLVMLGVLLILSISYALILRNSVANMLEMLWLRDIKKSPDISKDQEMSTDGPVNSLVTD